MYLGGERAPHVLGACSQQGGPRLTFIFILPPLCFPNSVSGALLILSQERNKTSTVLCSEHILVSMVGGNKSLQRLKTLNSLKPHGPHLSLVYFLLPTKAPPNRGIIPRVCLFLPSSWGVGGGLRAVERYHAALRCGKTGPVPHPWVQAQTRSGGQGGVSHSRTRDA